MTTPSLEKTIEFISYQIPSTKAGDYEITVKQETPYQTFTNTRKFHIASERFSIQPQEILSVFPPIGSLGDHSNVLPHIILERSTLPWERSANGETATPWLALLVFDEAEAPNLATVTIGSLKNGDAQFPDFARETIEQDSDSVTVIDVPRNLLEAILPSYSDLHYLCHVRRIDGEEMAVIIANRLPTIGKTSIVHLVSLENRYPDGSFDYQAARVDSEDKIRLVSLTNWRFACVDSSHTFSAMVRQLSQNHSAYRLPVSQNQAAEDFLKEGFIPIHHALRDGGKTVSWYRGPFVTGEIEDKLILPVHAADSLQHYYPNVGIFDLSYAAAWNIGRLLALQSSAFSTALYDWKRRRDQEFKRSQQDNKHPLEEKAIDTTMPQIVEDWLLKLALLDGLPFKYIVPQAELLPQESIRFFWIDPNWIRSLLDGAYSIGRITQLDYELDAAQPLAMPYPSLTGFLIRSEIVSGYTGLTLRAYADTAGTNPLEIVRQANLAKDIMLCLVEGNITRLDIQQKPEMLHFAVEILNENQFHKFMRSNNKELVDSFDSQRVVSVTNLARKMETVLGQSAGSLQAGDFAYEMIESAEAVSFYRA